MGRIYLRSRSCAVGRWLKRHTSDTSKDQPECSSRGILSAIRSGILSIKDTNKQ